MIIRYLNSREVLGRREIDLVELVHERVLDGGRRRKAILKGYS
jgi:hypothetical protein